MNMLIRRTERTFLCHVSHATVWRRRWHYDHERVGPWNLLTLACDYNTDKKAVLSQGKRAMYCVFLPKPNDFSTAIYIHCIKADVNEKL